MAQHKKDGVKICYYVKRPVKEKLDMYCQSKGQTATMAVEQILEKYIDDYFKIQEDKSTTK